jgi:hypothetical protein
LSYFLAQDLLKRYGITFLLIVLAFPENLKRTNDTIAFTDLANFGFSHLLNPQLLLPSF